MRGLGYLPDAPSDKDWGAEPLLSAASVLVAETGSARRLVAGILNQGGLGSCVANAGFQALRAAQIKALLERGLSLPEAIALAPLGSRLFGYRLARATHGDEMNDSGTYPRAFFQVVTKFGFPTEDAWTYDDRVVEEDGSPGKFTRDPGHGAYQAAFDQKEPTEYRRIFETGYDRVDVIKQAISQEHLIVFGTDVSRPFANGDAGNGKPLPPPVGLTIAGGHAMCLAEYDRDGAKGPNSWGEGFGDAGWFYFSWDYIAWERTRDLWIVKRAPVYSEAP